MAFPRRLPLVALMVALALPALPAGAQGMDSLLPRLTFPTATVTQGTKGCTPEPQTKVCEIRM
ncbi:hypothetical protein [Xinfangfangia pollutisoli]|uniref:hypothetical protein n=1 Tax=Xinfangfangia pollutisoli TaxID=2865960 RepID=UPI001CD7DF9D|nr:hypothetical protein [Xinfangfangia pollutisoli]